MNKIALKSLKSAYRILNPGSVVLISSGDDMVDNLFAVTWNMPLRKEPGMVAILSGKRHFSYSLIAKTGEFGVNVMTGEWVNAVFGCGTVSGHQLRDKFGRHELNREKSQIITAPLVTEAAASLECRVVNIHDMGASALITASILAGSADKRYFDGENWIFDNGLELIHHLGGNQFCLSSRTVTATGLDQG